MGYKGQALLSAAAIVVMGSTAAIAQDTTRVKPTSTRRIAISKEAPGEVAPPKTDTLVIYKTDTLTLTSPPRVDTVRTTNTITRVDTVTVIPPVRPMSLPGGLYFGFGGGVM